MKKNNKPFYLLLFVNLFFSTVLSISCSNNETNNRTTKEQLDRYKEPLMMANKELLAKDREAIRSYIGRRGWDMKTTETGLWYMIYEKGNGSKVQQGEIATIHAKISLLDGTVCYKTDSLHPKVFKVGRGGVESGLEEGILLLHQGDKARFILPPYMAHGLLGDEDKIPPRAIIVYELEVLKIDTTKTLNQKKIKKFLIK